MISQLLETAVSGELPTGLKMKAPTLDPEDLYNAWHRAYSNIHTLPQIGVDLTGLRRGWRLPITPNDRLFEIIGSYAYRTGMTLLEGQMNGIKGRIFGGLAPLGEKPFGKAMDAVKKGHLSGYGKKAEVAATVILAHMQMVSRAMPSHSFYITNLI